MAQMTDEQFQAWLDQHGGEVGRKDIEDEVDDPSGARDANGNVRKTKKIDRTEVTAKDGATITVRRIGGSLVSAPDAPQYDVTATTPPKPTTASGDKEGDVRPAPASSQIREVYRGGKWVTEPNPLYQAPEAPKPATVPTSTTEPYIVERMPDGSLRTSKNPNYQGPKPERGTTVTVKGGDGKTYLVPIDAQGNPGKAVDSGVPGEGTGPQGPALPTLVLGQVQGGLRAYKDQLNREVAAGRMTPAVADKRWAEAKELGGFAIQEAQTFQRDEESRRNADTNLRTNAMSNATSGFNSALSFIQDLNSKLPEGSTAGGKAFEALLGLQELQARRMGAFDNPYSDAATPRPLGSPAPAPSSPVPPPLPAAQNAGAGTGEPPARGNVPPAAPGAPPPAPVTAASVARPPVAAPAAPAAPVQGAPTAGEPGGPPLANGPVWEPPSAPPAAPPAPIINEVTGQPAAGTDYGRPGDPGYGSAPPVEAAPPPVPESAAPAEPMVTVRNVLSGETVTIPRSRWDNDMNFLQRATWKEVPAEAPTPAAAPSEPVTMTPPGEDFAALAQFNQPTPSVYPQLGAPDAGSQQDPVALRRAEIASTVPWKLDEQAYRWAVENGAEDDFWSVPKRVRYA